MAQTTPSPGEQVRALYEQAESRSAEAFEELLAKPNFGSLLARTAENLVALTQKSADVADLALRNLRLAGRADMTRLAQQLRRTEDKLERMLQEVEELREELAAVRETTSANGKSGSPREPKAR
jgi:uncharacterized protein YlxW (UPF0749 family)